MFSDLLVVPVIIYLHVKTLTIKVNIKNTHELHGPVTKQPTPQEVKPILLNQAFTYNTRC